MLACVALDQVVLDYQLGPSAMPQLAHVGVLQLSLLAIKMKFVNLVPAGVEIVQVVLVCQLGSIVML